MTLRQKLTALGVMTLVAAWLCGLSLVMSLYA